MTTRRRSALFRLAVTGCLFALLASCGEETEPECDADDPGRRMFCYAGSPGTRCGDVGAQPVCSEGAWVCPPRFTPAETCDGIGPSWWDDTDAGYPDTGQHANRRPARPVIRIQPFRPTTREDLECVIDVPSSDPDADPVTYRFAWIESGTIVSTATIVTSSVTMAGQEWACSVTPNDGMIDGLAATATTTVLP